MATCSECGGEILHVKDDWTDAGFPVDAEPLRTRGFKLKSPRDGERSQRAVLVDVELYRPHSASCKKLQGQTELEA